MSISIIFKDRKFSPLMWTQFFGALNDNILKNALVVLLAFKGVRLWGMRTDSLVTFATLIFILPFFLFSAHAGQIADKYEKSKLIRITKLAEILIMILAGVGFYLHTYELLFVVLFLMGLQSTFFGPVKYSAIPELVIEEKLTSANAYVEVGTFIAILIGTLAGAFLISLDSGELYVISYLIVVSILGYLTSRGIPNIKVAAPDLRIDFRPLAPTIDGIKGACQNKTVFNSVLGISWFWFLGAMILSLLPTITAYILNGNERVVSIFLAVFTIGIAIGAVICEKLSFERVEIGLVPFGSFGMSIFLVDIAVILSAWKMSESQIGFEDFFQTQNSWRLVLDLLGLAIFGGIFTVPLYTLIQQRSRPESRSRVIAANNILNALFMVLGSGVLMGFQFLKFSVPMILVIYSALNLLVAIYIYSLVPEFTLRFLAWIVAHCMYRIKTKGHANVPKEGAAIIACNHISYVDWLVISAAIKRPVRFVMHYKFADIPVLRYLMKHGGVIPIAGKGEDEKIFNAAFVQIENALKEGKLLCIFPEGKLTRNGELSEFKRGIEHIIAKTPVPVIPMAITGLWGSIFSHKDGTALKKVPHRFWSRIKLEIGELIATENVSAAKLEARVRNLISNGENQPI